MALSETTALTHHQVYQCWRANIIAAGGVPFRLLWLYPSAVLWWYTSHCYYGTFLAAMMVTFQVLWWHLFGSYNGTHLAARVKPFTYHNGTLLATFRTFWLLHATSSHYVYPWTAICVCLPGEIYRWTAICRMFTRRKHILQCCLALR